MKKKTILKIHERQKFSDFLKISWKFKDSGLEKAFLEKWLRKIWQKSEV